LWEFISHFSVTGGATNSILSDRYRLDERIGIGAMAEVWLARDLELERAVAVKLLNQTSDSSRFEREVRAAAALSHPNICVVYDCGAVDGRPFMVLEYLPGGTLEMRLSSEAPLPDEEAKRIASGLAEGLAYAHAHGVVHRDLKPANVLLDPEGTPKITDFGIAAVAGELTLTEEGTVLGTAAYISPEQVRAEPATPASDVYSFGVILYRILTGQLPFDDPSPLVLAQMHQAAEPPAITSLRPDAPPELARIAEAALSKQPTSRPADGSALLSALSAPAQPAEPGIAETGGAAAVTQVIRRRRGGSVARPATAFAGVVALTAAGIAVAVLVAGGPSKAPASPSSRHTPKGHRTSVSRPATTRAATASLPGATTRSATRASSTTRRSSTGSQSTTRSTSAGTTTAATTTAATTATTPSTATTAPTTTTASTTTTAP
jgi:serine/threonine-protein kinase